MNAGSSIRREISGLVARQDGANKPVAYLLANLFEVAEHCESISKANDGCVLILIDRMWMHIGQTLNQHLYTAYVASKVRTHVPVE